MFRNRLIELINEKCNGSQKNLSVGINVPAATVNKWYNGITEPNSKQLIKLANYFECSIDYLVGRASDVDIVEITTDLTTQQKELLNNFEKLNAEGKARLLGYLIAMLGIPMYARR